MLTRPKKKILHLITGLNLGGGAENMLLQILPKMQHTLDNRVCVIIGRGEIGNKLKELGIPVYYLKFKKIYNPTWIFRYRKVIKKFDPDVQINYLIHADIFGRIFGKLFGIKKIIPYIRNIHKDKKFLMFIDRLTIPLSDFVLTNSETAKRYYIKKIAVNKNKIGCIPNAFDFSKLDDLRVIRRNKLEELGISSDEFIIGSVARMEKQKNLPVLVKAFSIVKKKNPAAHLLIAGHGSQKKNIIKMIRKLHIERSVTLIEKRTDVLDILAAIDLFVLPSLKEGMSNAILEAMASRVLIMVSNIEENEELIQNKVDGFVFKKDDPLELASMIFEIIKNKEHFNFLIDNAFKKIKEKYNINDSVKKFENFLENI